MKQLVAGTDGGGVGGGVLALGLVGFRVWKARGGSLRVILEV